MPQQHAVWNDIIITLMAVFGPIIVVSIMLLIARGQKKQQNKINSATLATTMLDSWRKDAEFLKYLRWMSNKTAKITPENRMPIMKLLNRFEDIAVLWRDELLAENHVKEFFGSNIVDIRKNDSAMVFIKTINNEKPDYYFVNLIDLINLSKKWGI